MNTNAPFGPIVNGTQIIFYEYRPSKSAAISFIVLFACATLGHLIYLFRLRAWFFIPLILGGVGEVFGYYGRSWSSNNPDIAGPFILQNLLLLASPPFLAATIYMSYGRIITGIRAQKYSLISPRWMTKIYVLIDIGCVVSQVMGSVLPASGEQSSIELSKKILLGGLITQVVALGFFILTCWHAHGRIKRNPNDGILSDPSISWQNHFRVLELVTLILIIRSVVRTIEYLQGVDGFVASHELFIFLFDAFLMWLIMVAFLILHPGRLVRDARPQTRYGLNTEDNISLTGLV